MDCTRDASEDEIGLAHPNAAQERFSCTACRTRKLKCDRTKPQCSRCVQATDGSICVYPASRRKRGIKRRTAQDLEARLAHVEGFLTDNVSAQLGQNSAGRAAFPKILSDDTGPKPAAPGTDRPFTGGAPSGLRFIEEAAYPPELLNQGVLEGRPADEIVDMLNTFYFENQYLFVPIIQAVRYLKAFRAAPHLRPPLGLQYAIWALSSQALERYSALHDVFYRRARQYLENDEMQGEGEHFVTVGHAQAWILVATYEARRLLFTRASMSCARCIRLVGMMGLHRLDDESESAGIASAFLKPVNWVELEERRRVFWGAFCSDSHVSISTGWPSMIDITEATTHLPATESAYDEGREEETFSFDKAFSGRPCSPFASVIIVCQLFKAIQKHVQSRPSDHPEDLVHGEFWQGYRSLDTKLSTAFVQLPEGFKQLESLDNPIAVHKNLNLHAATICLHNAALERAETHQMPADLIQSIRERLSAAAQEIVSIMKKSDLPVGTYTNPLTSLTLYCATSVFIHQAIMIEKAGGHDEVAAATATSNIEYVMHCMRRGKSRNFTRLLLNQAILDIENNGVALSAGFSWFKRDIERDNQRAGESGHYVPILARSPISRKARSRELAADGSTRNSPQDSPIVDGGVGVVARRSPGRIAVAAKRRCTVSPGHDVPSPPAATLSRQASGRRGNGDSSPLPYRSVSPATLSGQTRSSTGRPAPTTECSSSSVQQGTPGPGTNGRRRPTTRIFWDGILPNIDCLGPWERPPPGEDNARDAVVNGAATPSENPGGDRDAGTSHSGLADDGWLPEVSFRDRLDGAVHVYELGEMGMTEAGPRNPGHIDAADPWMAFLEPSGFDGTEWALVGNSP